MRRSRSRHDDQDRHELIDIEARLAPYCGATEDPAATDVDPIDGEVLDAQASTPDPVEAASPA
ncbi:MAG: hypothetical protein ACSLFP_03485 [Acidimicrobiales bacterium]